MDAEAAPIVVVRIYRRPARTPTLELNQRSRQPVLRLSVRATYRDWSIRYACPLQPVTQSQIGCRTTVTARIRF